MEKELIDEIEKSSNDDELLSAIEESNKLGRDLIRIIKKGGKPTLLRILEKGGVRSIKIAKELFSRKGLTVPKEHLLAILESVKVAGIGAKEAKKIKEEATIRIMEKGSLDEHDLLTILDQIDSQKILESVIEGFVEGNENIPNYILREAIRTVKSSSLKEVLARRLRNQNPTTDDFLVIMEELEDLERFPKGSPLQIEALDKLWKKGIEPEDASWLIGFVPSLAEIIWERLRREERIKNLSIEQLAEIFRYTKSPEIKMKAGKELLPRIEKELKRSRALLKKNPRDTEMFLQINYLEKRVEELRKKLKKGLNDEKTEKIEIYISPQT